MRNAFVSVTCRVVSSSCRSGAPGGLPIVNVPAGTSTSLIPTEFETGWPDGGAGSSAAAGAASERQTAAAPESTDASRATERRGTPVSSAGP